MSGFKFPDELGLEGEDTKNEIEIEKDDEIEIENEIEIEIRSIF
jgi:hypothetical protein